MDIFNEFICAFSPDQNGFIFMWILAVMASLFIFIAVERWIGIRRYTNLDTFKFIERLIGLVKEKNLSDAHTLCQSGSHCAVPRVLGCGIKKAIDVPGMIMPAMEEESLRIIPLLEKRLNLIVTFGNLSTLIGLMGTIYGLILAFAAVAQPDVSPVEKSSMLAIGISAAMNTTLMGLLIAVPCVFTYSVFRSKIDDVIAEIDRYAIALLKVLNPGKMINKSFRLSSMRIREEVDTEPNMVPFMNLMVVLIPLLLSSSEFVKLGMIELKLPESSQAGGGNNTGEINENELAKVDLGIVVSSKGFTLFHYFKSDSSKDTTDIPLVDGKYDFDKLNREIANVKQKALYKIVRQGGMKSITQDEDIWKLQSLYRKNGFSSTEIFKDHEDIKIVAEDKIHFQTIVSVMDAARSIKTASGSVTLFPNVSLAGGIIQ